HKPTLAPRPRQRQHRAGVQAEGMIHEPVLLSAHRRPPGPAAAAPAKLDGGLEQAVVTSLLEGVAGEPCLVDTIAELAASALQAAPEAATTPLEVRALAARIATGLAVALLQSDLGERISAQLADQAPFAEGWLSCPE
ncbi:MAG: hypothetical protein ACKOZW_08960, partial [Cyanobium sp.]